MLTIAIPLFALPTANAHDPAWKIPTYAFISVSPNPVGVGQRTTIVVWLGDVIQGAMSMPASAANDIRFHDYKLTITKPDGKTETVEWPIVFDTTSSAYTTYTPNQVGTYTLNFSFPGQTYTWSGAYQNNTYLPSSKSTTLTVQEEPLPDATRSYPLPTEYWTRPIEGQNTDWWTISSHWLGNGSPQLVDGKFRVETDGVGPNTAHIMWSKPIQDGGVVGGGNVGYTEGDMFYTGLTYNRRMGNPIIMYGRLFYQEPLGLAGTAGSTVCVDLRTGQEMWRRNDVPTLSFGYYHSTHTPNMHGISYEGILFTANFARAFDARTGNPLFNVTNVPTGTAVLGPSGEHLRYVVNTTTKMVAQWNSSKLWDMSQMTPTILSTADASTAARYDWNITVPWLPSEATIVSVFLDDVLLGRNGSLPTMTTQSPYTLWAMSLKPGSIGSMLWMKTYDPPAGNVTRSIPLKGVDIVNRVFVAYDKDIMQFTGYSLDNGERLWTSTRLPEASDFDFYNYLGDIGYNTAYGKLYYSGFGGVLYCFDTKNGTLLWTYGNGGEGNNTYSGFETAWGHYPTFITTITDGKVYLETGEHSPNTPLYKGAMARCVDAYTGEELWTLMSWSGHHRREGYAVADGYYVFLNHYDMQIYSVGKGPSQLTVSAPQAGIELGKSLVISGTVTDISAGTKDSDRSARFPNGVPAVSDASMGDWMAYVYMQKPRPNATGVTVSIDVLDSNGNYRNIGNTTSDTSGMFSYTWTPDIEGSYTVIATFGGSESYYPSYAESSFAVTPSAPTPTQQPQISLPPTEMYIMAATAAIIVAIAIVGVMLSLMLKRRTIPK